MPALVFVWDKRSQAEKEKGGLSGGVCVCFFCSPLYIEKGATVLWVVCLRKTGCSLGVFVCRATIPSRLVHTIIYLINFCKTSPRTIGANWRKRIREIAGLFPFCLTVSCVNCLRCLNQLVPGVLDVLIGFTAWCVCVLPYPGYIITRNGTSID